MAPDSLDSDPPEVRLVRDFETFLRTSFGTEEFLPLQNAFKGWFAALVALPTEDLCLANLAAEYHLTHDDKMDLLLDTTLNFMDGTQDPRAALCAACMRYVDRGDPIVEEIGELARFIDFQAARKWLLPRRSLPGLLYSLDGTLWKERLSHTEVVRDPEILSQLRGRIRGCNDIKAFSTLASWVDAQKADSLEELAAIVRDKLGLPHLEEACVLELRIPEAAVRQGGNPIQKPTFADAGGYPPFLPSRRENQCGHARDLSTPEPEEQGGPEVWHAPLDARLASGLRYLGRPSRGLREGRWKSYNSRPSGT